MPKPVKNASTIRPSSDPNLRARQMMAEHMAKADDGPRSEPPEVPTFAEQLSAHMAKLGAKGGKVSGAKRMEMSATKRRAIAKKAAQARWGKKK